MEQKRLTKQRAIREKCLDCCCGQAKEVRLCPATDCPLYLYRLGYEVIGDGFTRRNKDMGKNIEPANQKPSEKTRYGASNLEEE